MSYLTKSKNPAGDSAGFRKAGQRLRLDSNSIISQAKKISIALLGRI